MRNKELIKLVQRIKDNIKLGNVISTAESCTGGMLASYLTEIPGSSEYFSTGIVSYSNIAKMKLLSVKKQTLEEFGAVSEEVAIEMATGCREISASNVSVSITGIAGPTGGSAQKPVGMVCFGVVSDNDIKSYIYHFTGNREEVRESACRVALELILNNI